MIHGVDQRSGAIRLWFTAYESTATERVRGVSSLVLRYRFTTSGLADSSSKKTKTGRQFFWRPVGREELAIPAAPATTGRTTTATAAASHSSTTLSAPTTAAAPASSTTFTAAATTTASTTAATVPPPPASTAPASSSTTLAAFILGTKVLFRTSHSATLQSCLSPRATKAMHVPY